ncbi:MAG: hypothetical protein AMXMBFR81_05420 [Chthonomonas sp.]|nr:phytanoyl-CoA dioxygenase family protein [Fimbriimonadaceae bacterium]
MNEPYVTLTISAAERERGRFDPETVMRGREAILRDGMVAIEDAVDPEHIAKIRDRMFEDLPAILSRTDTPFNFTRSNVQQDPPPMAEYLFRDVLVNEFVVQLTSSVMGQGMKNAFYSGNTALAHGTQRQPVHADMGHLWPNTEHATPPYALIVNMPMVDMDARNGSIELWPGTHLDTSVAMQDGDIKVSPERIEAQRAIRPPVQPKMRAGSVIIRDMRMWHAGMPNHTDQPRPMIAMIHWVSWWPLHEKLTFPKGTEALFVHPDLETVADFVDTPIPYLGRHVSYDLQPTN